MLRAAPVWNHSNVLAQRVQLDTPDVLAVDCDAACLHVVETIDEPQHRRLPVNSGHHTPSPAMVG